MTERRPLFVVDCDEVLLNQMVPTVDWLAADHGIDMPLSGQGARYRADGSIVPGETLARLSATFAERYLHLQTLVPGATEALTSLRGLGDVIILTNLPAQYRQKRIDQLAILGVHDTVQCNAGLKGPAVARIIEHFKPSATFFIDDNPMHHASIATDAPAAVRIQLIGDELLAKYTPSHPAVHKRITGWTDTDWLVFISQTLQTRSTQ